MAWIIRRFQQQGTVTMASATCVDEARLIVQAGIDVVYSFPPNYPSSSIHNIPNGKLHRHAVHISFLQKTRSGVLDFV